MDKKQEELNILKKEYETLNSKLKELTDDELEKVSGGVIKKYDSYDGLSTSCYYLKSDTEFEISPAYAKIQSIQIDISNNKKVVYFKTLIYDKTNNLLTVIRRDDELSLRNFLRIFDINKTLPVNDTPVSND